MTLTAASFFDRAHRAFSRAGDFFGAGTGTYTPPGDGATPVSCRVMRDDGGQTLGDYGRLGASRTVLQLSLADVPSPVPGALLVFAGQTYQLDDEDVERRVPGSHSVWIVMRAPEPTP